MKKLSWVAVSGMILWILGFMNGGPSFSSPSNSRSVVEKNLWDKIQEQRKTEGGSSLTLSKVLNRKGLEEVEKSNSPAKIGKFTISFGQMKLCGVKKSGEDFKTNRISLDIASGQSVQAISNQIWEQWWQSKECRAVFLDVAMKNGGLVCSENKSRWTCVFLGR